MSKQFSQEEIELVISEKLKGTGSRTIGKQLGRSKSAVNYVWNRVKPTIDQQPAAAPKILIFDVETAPEIYMGFGRYKQNIAEDFVLQEPFMLSFVAKWLDSTTIISRGLPDYEGYVVMKPCDESLIKDLHALLDEADIIVAHNLLGFDMKVANARFVRHGLSPISPTKFVDTLKIAKANFKFPTNKLDTIARYLNCGSKMSHSGASLWRGCMEGDEESWNTMMEYNLVDVTVLEEVYLKLRAFDKRHPNLAIFYPDVKQRCVCCGSDNLELTDKRAYTSVSEFEVYQCGDCGKHNRARVNQLDKTKRNSLLMNCQ